MSIGTRDLLLKEAETLTRTRGYAAFSYADLAERVGIRKASVHHHFPTKEVLGVALIDGYLAEFKRALAKVLEEERSAEARLAVYSGFFIDSLRDGLMPLCAALSAETAALPQSMRAQVSTFFELHLDWLSGVVRDGIADGEFRADLDVRQTATMLLSVLEGASLVAWALKDSARIQPTFGQALESLSETSPV
ncbi:TetR family transcriptional regulator [Methyloceanibacter stevinii]|uniref:TetR family transcriptional regulator n=1 Tax=Methyloceanibacter stevinii TaxID=1774970 RepID=A0A1E3VQ58_9HYPH|nr:TetR/AcrR family transcriptional regulator [Methyloceanibacter stevinii]ODR95642.1 TetR family transcriptional regulator [Methyloceanibacter stevinii]